MINEYLDWSEEVQQARAQERPIVALESTILAHGMPYPENVATAKKAEQLIRDAGAVPATIALVEGKVKVGLNEDQLERFGKEGVKVVKASRRDIPFLLKKGSMGATTVAATMFLADKAGIPVFATGGIGGVHRGALNSMDISADLQELAKTNVLVVSAGAKAILDLGLTLEYLETFGVPVVGYQTDEFPSFYTRKSGFAVDYRLNEPSEIAATANLKWNLGLEGGILVANPIPETHQLDYLIVDIAIKRAIREAEEEGIKGKDITPFLLLKLEDLTEGASLNANKELYFNNVKLAAQVAIAYKALADNK